MQSFVYSVELFQLRLVIEIGSDEVFSVGLFSSVFTHSYYYIINLPQNMNGEVSEKVLSYNVFYESAFAGRYFLFTSVIALSNARNVSLADINSDIIIY